MGGLTLRASSCQNFQTLGDVLGECNRAHSGEGALANRSQMTEPLPAAQKPAWVSAFIPHGWAGRLKLLSASEQPHHIQPTGRTQGLNDTQTGQSRSASVAQGLNIDVQLWTHVPAMRSEKARKLRGSGHSILPAVLPSETSAVNVHL